MIKTVIYVDVLMFVNTVINFLLLRLTSVISKHPSKPLKSVLSAFLSALFSLYIFLPSVSFFIELIFRIFSSLTAVVIGFKFISFKKFITDLGIFYAVSFIFAGFMMALVSVTATNKMTVNNGVVYFDISPLLLVTFSFVFYVIIFVVRKITKKDAEFAKRQDVVLYCQEQSVNAVALVDTGHNLKDSFGKSAVIIIDRSVATKLFGAEDTLAMLALKPPINEDFSTRFRLVPIDTVNCSKLLSAIRIDKMIIKMDKRLKEVKEPVVVLSDSKLGSDFSVIIPPDVLNE